MAASVLELIIDTTIAYYRAKGSQLHSDSVSAQLASIASYILSLASISIV